MQLPSLNTPSNVVTIDELRSALPRQLRLGVSEQALLDINAMLNDPDLHENFKDNLLTYTSVLKDGKYKIMDYVKAVSYVSYKLLGLSNVEAYKRTHPDRYARFLAEDKSDKAISAFVSAYNNTQLVNAIYEQTLIPTWVVNAPVYQEAINIQVELMRTASSEKVRQEAANSLLTHLKRPETAKIQLDITNKESNFMDELRDVINQMAIQQQNAIASGMMNAQDVAKEKIINTSVLEGEYEKGN